MSSLRVEDNVEHAICPDTFWVGPASGPEGTVRTQILMDLSDPLPGAIIICDDLATSTEGLLCARL
jgi:hypothetical protein